ncbi:MAG TPA: hypothetical protein DEP82_14505 [Arthrobacter bacterium]|nr:hypothetical protein [Arthrobacter sp.]
MTGPMEEDINKAIALADPDAHVATNDVDKSETKAQAALTLKLYGASYTEIKNTLHYSSAYRARMAVERVLATASDSIEDRDKMRVLISRRLDRLQASVMSKAVNPNDPQHLAYNARALAIIDRQARLHGVDAPTQIMVTANDQYIEEYINAILPHARADQEQIEADIMDADVLEEGDDVLHG